ncbi:MAG: hypothetical protein DSZ05_01655, partial [Sulfurospirillum sp.]
DGISNWRLPTFEELQTLQDFGKYPKIDPVFNTKKSGKYWTSTEYPFDPSTLAYYIDFSRGFSASYGDRSVYEKSNTYAVRCVRGEPLQERKFTRDATKNIVTDHTTHLMWEDTSHITSKSSVAEAIKYCEDMTLGGYSDWHLPNINEIYTITDKTHYDPAINAVFNNRVTIGSENSSSHYRKANYWTSTYYGPNSDNENVHYYRTLNARDGASHRCKYGMDMHVRCVRTAQ